MIEMKRFSLCLLCALFLVPGLSFAEVTATPQGTSRHGTFEPANILTPLPSTGKEALLISFYRNSGRTPDFKRWSLLTENALKAATYDRSVIALNEQVRLQTIFQNTDPSEYLVINAPVDVSKYSATQELLFMPTFSGANTLTQDVYGEKMAIIVEDLKRFQKIVMTNAEAGVFYGQLMAGGKQKPDIPVYAQMVVRPRKTVFSKEGRVGKGDHYLFFVDLAQITLWRKEESRKDSDKALWTWKADWYKVEDDNAELLQLYQAIN